MKGEAWERVFLTDAAQNGAVCLDGSPGAYYIRTNTTTGHTTDPSKWIVFMEGGGWCANRWTSTTGCITCAGRASVRGHTSSRSSVAYERDTRDVATERMWSLMGGDSRDPRPSDTTRCACGCTSFMRCSSHRHVSWLPPSLVWVITAPEKCGRYPISGPNMSATACTC